MMNFYALLIDKIVEGIFWFEEFKVEERLEILNFRRKRLIKVSGKIFNVKELFKNEV